MFFRPWEWEEAMGTPFDGGVSGGGEREARRSLEPSLPVTALAQPEVPALNPPAEDQALANSPPAAIQRPIVSAPSVGL